MKLFEDVKLMFAVLSNYLYLYLELKNQHANVSKFAFKSLETWTIFT